MMPVKTGVMAGGCKIEQRISLKNIAAGHGHGIGKCVLVAEPERGYVAYAGHHRGDRLKIGNNKVNSCRIERPHIIHEPTQIQLEHCLHIVHPPAIGNKGHPLHHPVGLENLNLLQLLLFPAAHNYLNLVPVRFELADKLPATADMSVTGTLHTEKDPHAALFLY